MLVVDGGRASLPALFGRGVERAELEQVLDDVGHGPLGLLIEGEPGIGKTALLQEAVASARERLFWVLTCRCVDTESKLSFAALADLFEGVAEQALDALPSPQREAVEVALLRRSRPRRVEPRAVSTAVLGVLRALASSAPVVVAVDDLPWIDASSARALSFALRRLVHERVAVLGAARSGVAVPFELEALLPPESVRRLVPRRLSVADLDALLRARLGRSFALPVLSRLWETSGGNPFFALELARAQARAGIERVVGRRLPVTDTLRALVSERLEAVSAQTRELLLAASALAQPTIPLLTAALGGRERGSRGLARAEAAGIIEVQGERVRFTHPLLASVLYAEARPERRRRLHARLARAVSDPEERAQHLAAAASGPDAGVAVALVEAAEIARSRGAPETAAGLLELSAGLTPEGEDELRRRRQIEASECHFEAGDSERAVQLLTQVAAALAGGEGKADALARLARVKYHAQATHEAVAILEEALAQTQGNLELRAAVERDLAWVRSSMGDVAGAHPHAAAAKRLAERSGEPTLLASSLTVFGVLEFLSGNGLHRDVFERALEMEEWTERLPVALRPGPCYAFLLKWADAFPEARARFVELRQRAHDRGDEGALPFLLFHFVELECWAGEWERAASYAREALEIARLSGQRVLEATALYAVALVEAHQGLVEAAHMHARECSEIAGEHEAAIRTWALSVLAFVELSLGNPEGTHSYLGPLADLVEVMGLREPAVFRFLPDEIEALVALGELEKAESLLSAFEERGRALKRSWALASGARCRGLLLAARREDVAAIASLEAALHEHERLSMPFERARTLLVLGIVRRRAKRRRAAREALEQAVALFEQLGAPLWAAKARAELGRIASRRAARDDRLTETEQRIAELVARGRTNREVADELFITVKTVEANLTRIYRKLGVRSRTELGARIAGLPVAPHHPLPKP